jgi:hypothetical protein
MSQHQIILAVLFKWGFRLISLEIKDKLCVCVYMCVCVCHKRELKKMQVRSSFIIFSAQGVKQYSSASG